MKKKVYFFCIFLIFRICSSLARKDTKIFAFMQINGEKVAIFWCKVYGVKCRGGEGAAKLRFSGRAEGATV